MAIVPFIGWEPDLPTTISPGELLVNGMPLDTGLYGPALDLVDQTADMSSISATIATVTGGHYWPRTDAVIVGTTDPSGAKLLMAPNVDALAWQDISKAGNPYGTGRRNWRFDHYRDTVLAVYGADSGRVPQKFLESSTVAAGPWTAATQFLAWTSEKASLWDDGLDWDDGFTWDDGDFWRRPGVSEREAPTAAAVQINLAGAITSIDDEADRPDALWMVANDTASAVELRVDFATPAVAPEGPQKFRALLRTPSTSRTVTIELYEAGALVSSLGSAAVGSTAGQIVEFSWDASLLGTASGADVQMRITADPAIEVGALEWVTNGKPTSVIRDGAALTEVATSDLLDAATEWWWNDTTGEVYLWDDGSTDPNPQTIELVSASAIKHLWHEDNADRPLSVVRDGVTLTEVTAPADLVNDGQWWWDDANSRVYIFDAQLDPNNDANAIDLNLVATALDLTGAPPADDVMVVRDWAILISIYDETNSVALPDAVQWSARGDATNWPVPGSNAARQVQAGRAELLRSGGALIGGAAGIGGHDAVVWGRKRMWAMNQQPAPVTWRFDVIAKVGGRERARHRDLRPHGLVVVRAGLLRVSRRRSPEYRHRPHQQLLLRRPLAGRWRARDPCRCRSGQEPGHLDVPKRVVAGRLSGSADRLQLAHRQVG